jgi:hypothetical protein
MIVWYCRMVLTNQFSVLKGQSREILEAFYDNMLI